MVSPQLRKISVSPGVNSQLTQGANSSSWWKSNLVQWRDGLLERISGWRRLIEDQAAGLIRAMHGYQDLGLTNNLLLGTDAGAQLYAGSGIYSFSYVVKSSFIGAATVSGPGATTATLVTTASNFTSGITPGQQILIRGTFSLGGRKYVAPTYLTIASIVNANTFTVTLPQPTLTGASLSQLVYINPTTSPGVYDVIAELADHGFSPGDIMTANFGRDDFSSTTPGGPRYNLPPGDYVVKSVISSSRFTIDTQYENAAGGFVSTGITGRDDSLWSRFGAVSGTPTVDFSVIESSQPGRDSNWYLDNLGELGLISATGEPIYYYHPPGGVTPIATLIASGPQINTGMFVAMPQAQIIAFGSEVLGVQDPMLVRWCDTSDYTQWTAAVGNQAGSYRLSQGSRIVGGIQAPMATMLWTDVGLWVMGYMGPPLIYSFVQIATGCGLIAPKAQIVLNSRVYWMGNRQFYVFNGTGMTSLDCTVWDFVFNDLDQANVSKCFGGANSINDEGFFFFPSASGGTGEIDSYVKFTLVGDQIIWDQGRLSRTAWLDQSVFGQALAGDLNRRIQQHNTGFDADGEPITGAFIESGYQLIDDGTEIPRVNEIIPDMKWFGDVPGAVAVTLKGAMYPQGSYFTKGPYGMDQANKHIRPRMRARYLAFRIDWVPRMGQSSRIGSWLFRMRPRGRKP